MRWDACLMVHRDEGFKVQAAVSFNVSRVDWRLYDSSMQKSKIKSSSDLLEVRNIWLKLVFSAFRSAASWCARTVPWRPESGRKWNSHWPNRVHCQRSCTATTCNVTFLYDCCFTSQRQGKVACAYILIIWAIILVSVGSPNHFGLL